MKNSMRTLAAVLAAVITVQTTIATFNIAEASATAVSSATKASRSAAIAKSIGAFERDTKVLKVPVEVAAKSLVASLSQSSVTKEDILSFVARYTTPAQAKQAAKNIEFALKGVSAESFAQMSETQQTQVIGEALKATNAQGLAWSGCAGIGVGVALVVAALIVGIIGITKMAGKERIAKKYDDKRADRTAQYNRDRDNVMNRPANIQTEINTLGNKIVNANAEVSYWQGVLTASLNNGDLAGAQNANAQIQAYTLDIQHYNNQIDSLNNELSL